MGSFWEYLGWLAVQNGGDGFHDAPRDKVAVYRLANRLARYRRL